MLITFTYQVYRIILFVVSFLLASCNNPGISSTSLSSSLTSSTISSGSTEPSISSESLADFPPHSSFAVCKQIGDAVTILPLSTSIIHYLGDAEGTLFYKSNTYTFESKTFTHSYKISVVMNNGNVTFITIGIYTPAQYSFYVTCSVSIPDGYSIYVIGDFCDWKLNGAMRLVRDYGATGYNYRLEISLSNTAKYYKYIISETDSPSIMLSENYQGNREITGNKKAYDTDYFG